MAEQWVRASSHPSAFHFILSVHSGQDILTPAPWILLCALTYSILNPTARYVIRDDWTTVGISLGGSLLLILVFSLPRLLHLRKRLNLRPAHINDSNNSMDAFGNVTSREGSSKFGFLRWRKAPGRKSLRVCGILSQSVITTGFGDDESIVVESGTRTRHFIYGLCFCISLSNVVNKFLIRFSRFLCPMQLQQRLFFVLFNPLCCSESVLKSFGYRWPFWADICCC